MPNFKSNDFVLFRGHAAKREGQTIKVKFTGLPATETEASVLFEEPRKIQIEDGAFEDWFAPNEVHVYRLNRAG